MPPSAMASREARAIFLAVADCFESNDLRTLDQSREAKFAPFGKFGPGPNAPVLSFNAESKLSIAANPVQEVRSVR